MKRSPRPSPGGWTWRRGLPAAILLLGLALRLFRLGDANLWWDEALALWGVRKGLPGVTLWTASDVHPPLYFWALWAWTRLAGESEFALRALSAAAGVLTVAVTYSLGTRAAGRRVGVLAALLTATARFHVWWSQEARMYVLAGLLGTLSLYLFLRWLDAERPPTTERHPSALGPHPSTLGPHPSTLGPHPSTLGPHPSTLGPHPGTLGRHPWRPLALYALATAGALYTIFLMGALLLVQNLVVAALLVRPGRGWRPTWPMVRRWIVAQAGIAASGAVWMIVAWGRMRTWSVAEAFDPRLFARLYATLLTTGVSVDIGRYTTAVLYPFLLLGLGAAALVAHRRRPSAPADDPSFRLIPGIPGLTLGLAAFLPAAAVYLATIPRGLFYTPHVEARYLLPFAPAFWVILAWGVVAIGSRWRLAGRLAAVTLMILWLLLLPGHYRGRARRDDLRTMVRAIASQARPGDAVLLSSGGRYPLFLHYYDGLPGTADLPPMVKIPPGEGVLDAEDVDAVMAPLAARYGRLWLAEVEAHLTDPEGLARDWLSAYAPEVLALPLGYNALRLYDPAGRAPDVATESYAPQHPLDLAIGGGQLWGWELPLPAYAPEDVARVALLWVRPPATPIRVSLRNPRGQVLLSRTLEAASAAVAEAAPCRQQFDFCIAAATPAGAYDVVLDVGGEQQVLGTMRVVGTRRLPRSEVPDAAVGARVGPSITLLGYTLWGHDHDAVTTTCPGESLTLDLYWSTDAKLERDHTVFTHLLGEAHNPRTQGPVWGQHDAQPADGGYPTTQWLVGDIIVDRHTLAIDGNAPAGEYRIEAGLYTVEDGSRLQVQGPNGEAWGDRVLLEAPVRIVVP